MALQSNPNPLKAWKLLPLAAVLLLATLLIVSTSNLVLAQDPPEEGVHLVNGDEDFVERKKDGRFIARPVFDRKPAVLYYAVRHPDTGEWLTTVYGVRDGEKERQDGWEYSFEYPFQDDQETLDPDRAYLLALMPRDLGSGEIHVFYTIIPVYQPGGLWDRVLRAFDPGKWGRALARWTVEGTHGTLCGVVEKASGRDADNCRGDGGR